MPEAIKPTVGRTLYYFESAKHAQDVEAGYDQPFIAFVTYVLGDSSINILAISHHNIPHPHLGVTLRQPGDDLPNGPHAGWMPYQVQQVQAKVAKPADVQIPIVPAELIPVDTTAAQVESLAPAASAPVNADTTQPAAAAPEASAS